MRRGHHGTGGWRNENPRHFRPRGGGPPHFRPPRGYGLINPPRFPPPRSMHHGPPIYNNPQRPMEEPPLEHNDRKNFHSGRQYNQQRHERNIPRGQRQILPYLQRLRHNDDQQSYYDDNSSGSSFVNRMGDIDHRQLSSQEPNNPIISPWAKPFAPHYEDKTQKPYGQYDRDTNKLQADYTGHRPPSSDHYGGNTESNVESANTFSRSVDDTVDLIRQRLLNRESQPPISISRQPADNENLAHATQAPSISKPQDAPCNKRRTSKQKMNVSTNCDTIKNKIVHQLFKMDKDKIHKLMDNPNSTNKFEYAISSLITESQNSYNRHLRSAAEKSLSTSAEFMHNDTNTIYEDTFMKQMQCILDPQDTVLLEDMKPMVLAELCKVLQLSDLEQAVEEQPIFSQKDHTNYEQYPSDAIHDYQDNCIPSDSYPTEYDNYNEKNVSIPDSQTIDNFQSERKCEITSPYVKTEVLYERRHRRESKSMDHTHRRRPSSDIDYDRREMFNEDNLNRINAPSTEIAEDWRRESRTPLSQTSNDLYTRSRSPDPPQIEDRTRKSPSPVPLFFADRNLEVLSDDDDPFAELDKQYHVVVDHNFIEPDDLICQEVSIVSHQHKTPNYNTDVICSADKSNHDVHFNDKIFAQAEKSCSNEESHRSESKSIDNLTQNKEKSSRKLSSSRRRSNSSKPSIKTNQEVKQELLLSDSDMSTKSTTPVKQEHADNLNIKQEKIYDLKDNKKLSNKVQSETNQNDIKSSTPTISRKRHIDVKPAHRKEKRKKSESSQPESSKQILNKNIIINVNDCAAKSSERCETPKSVFNLFFSKDKSDKKSTKQSKMLENTEKTYSDKYVKRKETTNDKNKDSENEKKNRDSSSSTHSILSPTDIGSQTPKLDGKVKLKTIDIFTEQPRKSNLPHQAHRNTAAAPVAVTKVAVDVKKPILIQTGRKLSRRHIATQVSCDSAAKECQTDESRCCTSRYVQTERTKKITRAAQTTPVEFKVNKISTTTDAFERMKEIDMEIQVLLQEKFKLYNSIEAKDTCSSTMQSLGMAVLNVTPLEGTIASEAGDDQNSEDTIVEEFTNIPVEELEQIALESVEHTPFGSDKRNRRTKALSENRKNSESPSSIYSRKTKRKAKTPNISLIEQIITDDRPLEDIISLDDLEAPVEKSKSKKGQKAQLKPKKKIAKKLNLKETTPDKETPTSVDIKECSVIVIREDFSKYLKPKAEVASETPEVIIEQTGPSIVEESVVNDLQFDMLDVSEDIVIGDVCEVKNEKDTVDTSIQSINEEIILDNSQSLADEMVPETSSGGVCKMFDFSSDENLRRDTITVTGNGDAVLAMECMENQFIAACLDGNVYHYSIDGQLLNTLRGSNLAVTCLTIVKEKYGTTVYTGSLDSRIRYYDLETGLEKGPECNVLSPIQTMDRAWDTIFVGTRTGFVLQFECKNNMLIPVSTVKFSEQSILALRAMKEGPRKVLLVAARSEPVTVKDAQSGLLLRTLEGPKMTVYTLLFEDGKVYCGTSSHLIHAFDYASGSHVWSHAGGKGCVCLRWCGGLVFAGCYDGCVYVYREAEPTPLAQLRGPSLMLLSLAVLGSKIIAGYKDRSLYIWKIPLSIMQEMIL